MNPLPPEVMDEIIDEIYQGRSLNAVKIYRASRGATLLEAKTFVEDLTEKLKSGSPERFVRPAATGCLGLLVMLTISTAILIASLLPNA